MSTELDNINVLLYITVLILCFQEAPAMFVELNETKMSFPSPDALMIDFYNDNPEPE